MTTNLNPTKVTNTANSMANKTYNVKAFLCPNSHRTKANYHAKVMEDGVMKITISDCFRSIQLWNDLNNNEERGEAIEKLFALEEAAHKLRKFLEQNYKPQ